MSTAQRERDPARSAVDPRIRARRIEVRRQQGRRRLRVLVALVMAAAALGLGYAAASSALLDVDEVVVRGAERTPVDQVVGASGLTQGQPLHSVDGGAVARSVERLPWVDTARTSRSLTGTVTVEVDERTAVAVLPVTGGGFVLVDLAGRQLARVDEPGSDHLPLGGVEASGVPGEPVGAGAQAVLRLLGALTPTVRQEVAGLGLDGPDLVLDLVRGGRVRLGDGAELEPKLVALETMLARVDLRCLGGLDLRVPSAPALTRVPPPDGDPADPLSDLSKCP